MSDEDISLDEKRVFDGRRGTAQAFVASDLGLARVEVSDDQIGRFGLVHREKTRDVAVDSHEGTVAIATEDDVLVDGIGESGGERDDDGAKSGGEHEGGGDESSAEHDDDLDFRPTGFGPAVAVSFADGVVAADPRGRIARRDGTDWITVATVDAPIVAVDGDLVATDVGVYRIESTDDQGVALAEVRDVAGPLAATAGGIYRLEDGVWRGEVRGDATAVAGSPFRSAAIVDGDVLERQEDPDDWQPTACPATDVVDLAVGRAIYAITAEGTLFVDPPTAKDGSDGWASRSLGLTDVAALAVLDATE